MSNVSLVGINKAYGDARPTINRFNLQIDAGEFCVFVGPSGCGKSTLLRMVAGLEEITSGELRIADRMVNDVPPANRGVAMVFQNYALYPHMTVAQNMAFALKLAKLKQAEIDEKVQRAAKVLQLDKLLDRYPKQLSGGQRQRVAIGRAIVREPKLFLFDEPLSNLDAALRVQTRIEIARLHREFGKASVIYVTHDQVEAMTLADKIVLLNAGDAVAKYGSIAQVGAPLELYHRPRNRFVAGFIGSPNMNFLPATLEKVEPDTCTVALKGGGQLAACVRPNAAQSACAGDPLMVGIRPEHIRLADAGGAEPGQAGEVVFAEFLGEHSYVHVALQSGVTVIAKAGGTVRVRIGDRVKLVFDAEHLHVFDADDQSFAQTRDLERLAA
ncbi:ABC transporter ATP-binding protein [Burkholderia guangdongensis]|uniref:ABC transporter ATP-binding protein n=1 Tax=Burkholderia guangdongensis TaxID=1792500 RepID=UPI0015C6FA47|nr:sn-glycerol-3-phosphate ABC transporter ATP-binding protein UgpC [Burkholderia guangdongensis]